MSEPTINGTTQFYIGVNLSADDVRDLWSASRIADFFDGLAQIVLATKENAVVESNVESTTKPKERG